MGGSFQERLTFRPRCLAPLAATVKGVGEKFIRREGLSDISWRCPGVQLTLCWCLKI